MSTSVINEDRVEVIVVATEKIETPTGAKGEPGPIGPTGPVGPKGDKGDKGDTGTAGTDGTHYLRQTTTKTTAVLTANAREAGFIPLATAYEVYKIQTDTAARVRLYDSVVHRDADLARPRGTDPAVSTDHGVMLDFALPTPNTFTMSPVMVGICNTGDSNVPITIDNIGSAGTTITVIITYLRKE